VSDVERCVAFVRGFDVRESEARELCRDPDLQRCAAFWRPRAGDDSSQDAQLDNLIACYGTRERSPDV
jgi:hypothetical protein